MGRHGLHRWTSSPLLISTSYCTEPSFLPFCLRGNIYPLWPFMIISLLLPWVCDGRKGEVGRLKGGREERWKRAQIRDWQTNKLYGRIRLVEWRTNGAQKGQPRHLVWKIHCFWNESLFTDKYFHVSVFPCGENVALGSFQNRKLDRVGTLYTQHCLQFNLDGARVSASIIHSLRIKFYLCRYRLLHKLIKATLKKNNVHMLTKFKRV